MPCCHIAAAGPFLPSFTADCQRFSTFVGKGWPLPAQLPTLGLVSALHIDLRLWNAPKPLPKIYVPNNAMVNAWRTARPPVCKDPFTALPGARAAVEALVRNLPVLATAPCVLSVYDAWVLDTMQRIRAQGLAARGGPGFGGSSTLSTFGKAQKIINIYWKYQACWNSGGCWNAAPGGFLPNANPAGGILCALHCPLDSVLFKKVRDGLALGRWLREQGLMDSRAYLRQANGVFSSWSNLDCLCAYYGFQRMLRRVATSTWPAGCACSGQGGAAGGSFPPAGQLTGPRAVGGPDWIEAADSVPEDVIAESAAQVMAVTSGGEPPRKRAAGGEPRRRGRKMPKLIRMPKTKEVVTKTQPVGAVPKTRDVRIMEQPSRYKSLKWNCKDRYNAGALSFDNKEFEGTCYVNSVVKHRKKGGENALWEQIRDNGYNFRQQPGFNQAPTGPNGKTRVAGVGSGSGYLGYRTFKDEKAAREYLKSVGLPPVDCP